MFQHLKLFEGLTSVDQARFLGKMKKKTILKDSIVFYENEPGEWMYILVKGLIEIVSETKQGDMQTLSVINEGETFGEMALLTGEVRSATAKAATNVELYVLHREVFDELVNQYASIANYFTRLLCKRLMKNNNELLRLKNEQLRYNLDFLNTIPSEMKRALLLASLLGKIKLDFMETYFEDPEFTLKLIKISIHTQLFQINEDTLHFHQASIQSIHILATNEINSEETQLFLLAAAQYYISCKLVYEAISIYAKFGFWSKALSYYEINLKELSSPKEDHMNVVNLLDQCPDEQLFTSHYFEVAKLYLEYMANLNPQLGFSRLEQVLNNKKLHYSEIQKSVLYEYMADFCFELGFDQKALDYINLAEQFIQPQQSNQELYAIAKKKFNKMKNVQKVSASKLLFNKNKLMNLTILICAFFMIIFFSFIEPFVGLQREGMLFIGITFVAILFWMTNLMSDYLVSLLMCMAWVLMGVASPESALSGFSSTLWLFIVFVLILGVAIMSTGIMYRVSLWLLKIFPKTYRGQLFGLAVTAVLINPLIPSGMTKSLISSPIAVNISDALGFKNRSKGSAGMVLTTFLLFVYLNPFFMTAGVSNFLALGLVSGYEISFIYWFWYALPSLCIFIMAMLFFAFYVYKPEKVNHRLSDQLITEQMNLLGKLKKNEVILLSVLIFIIFMLFFQNLHGISGVWILLIGLAFLIMTRVVERTMIKKTIDFTSLLHIGVALGFAQVAASVGADLWFSQKLIYIIEPFTRSPYLFLPVLAILIFIVCFFVDAIPAIILLIVSLLPLFVQLGYDPWILIFVVLLTTGPFFLSYQSEIYLATYYATEEKAFSHKQGRHFSLWYAFVVLLIIICSIPFWKMIELL